MTKPLGRKAYGSIGHLPSSRLGAGDYHIPEGQARICTEKARDGMDTVYVEEKLDGSCCAVANLDGHILPLTRAGYLAHTSPYEQHWLFGCWVQEARHLFRSILQPGERLVGEWLAQAHGTLYDDVAQPFVPFDLFLPNNERMLREEFLERVLVCLQTAPLVHHGGPISTKSAMHALQFSQYSVVRPARTQTPEGLVYRVERDGQVDFLAKWVRGDKQDGKYLPEISGCPAVWHWGPKLEREAA